MLTFRTCTAEVVKVSFGYLAYLEKYALYMHGDVLFVLVLRRISKSTFLAELKVSARMPKSEFTATAHRQRQAWQGGLPRAIVHLHHHMHRHASICTIICTIIRTTVGTIMRPPQQPLERVGRVDAMRR